MYNFVSGRNKVDLHNDYRALFQHNLDRKWDKMVLACPSLAGAMLPGMTATKLLVAKFRKLVDVYLHYTNYVNRLTPHDKAIVNKAAQDVFNFKSFTKKIAMFLDNPINQYEVHNCVYCDSTKVSVFYHHNRSVRRFEIEHVLDKGSCPLVALSLYNLVPACSICNGPALKGTKLIGHTNEEIKHLSPTNPSYDFWHKVLFVIKSKSPNISDIDKISNAGYYEIDFYYKDKVYANVVDLFGLKDRYNTDFLHEALRYLDLKDKYTNRQILDIAKILGKTYDEVYEDIFKIKFDQTHHSLYRKAKEDIIGITTFG